RSVPLTTRLALRRFDVRRSMFKSSSAVWFRLRHARRLSVNLPPLPVPLPARPSRGEGEQPCNGGSVKIRPLRPSSHLAFDAGAGTSLSCGKSMNFLPKLVFSIVFVMTLAGNAADELRVGLIGLDTSHVTAFTALLNDPKVPNHVSGAKVVAAFKGGSSDIESSRSRVDGYTKELREKYSVSLYDNLEELCRHIDAVMLEGVDGRPHHDQAI